MADSFFKFDTTLSNINDDDGGGGDGSEDEYDALNNETFGIDSEDLDWEVEHEQLAGQLESSRRSHLDDDSVNSQLEASLSKLVLDETDAPLSSSLNTSNVWQHELQPYPVAPNPIPSLKNVCTVEELERQLRQKSSVGATQTFFQPRFPVILQRPPGMQAPVPLPFAPQQPIGTHHQINQPINKLPNQINQMGHMGNPIMPPGNQMNQSLNQFMHNASQNSQSSNQFMQNANQMNQGINQMGVGHSNNQLMQNVNQMSQSNQILQNQLNQTHSQMMHNQIGQPNSQMVPNMNHLSQNSNQLMQNVTQLSQSNHLLQNINHLSQSNNQLLQNLGQQVIPNQQNQLQANNSMGPNQMGQTNNAMMQNQMGQSNNSMLQNQMGQSNNSIMHNQMGQSNNSMMQNQMGQSNNAMMQNQMGQSNNSMMQNQMGQSNNPMMQNQMGQSNNSMMQNQMGQSNKPMMQNVNQMGQANNSMIHNQMGQSNNSMMHNQMGQSNNPMMQNVNQMGQVNNQMIQNKQMMANGNYGPGMGPNQMMPTHTMNQPRMIGPPGLNASRPAFNSNVGQFNPNYRGPPMQSKPMDQSYQNQVQMNNQSPQLANQSQMIQTNQQPMGSNANQSPQNKGNQTKQAQRTEQKPQVQKNDRTLIFNNSAQKNVSYQNLVQLIQNTHPMLQFNTGFHNASHHPMLNNRTGVFNNQNVNHPMFNQNQRLNGNFNNRHLMNGDDVNHDSLMGQGETDEYAGLMSQREKQWLLNIQMLQLNTGTPYIDDFYYTVFLERQSKKEKESVKEAHKANQQNHPFYSGGVKQEQHSRSRHNSGRHNSTSEDAPTPRTYVPAQFENSLGKLQCGSVTAPRKIIDVDVVQGESNNVASGRQSRAASVASTNNPLEAPQVKKTKQLLLDIEALYLILLRLEELNDPLAISNALIMKEREEKQRQLELAQQEAEADAEDSNLFLRNIESVQRRPRQDPQAKETAVDKRQVVSLAVSAAVAPAPVAKNLLDENKEELVSKLFGGLLHEDRLQQFMMVRKGKALVCRSLRLSPSSHGRERAVWSRVMRALPSAARRDDGSLLPLAAQFRRYIQNSTGWAAMLESCALLTEALDPARTPYALTSSFTLTCVCALIEKASSLTGTADATPNERQWGKFLRVLARALRSAPKVAPPSRRLPEAALLQHVRLLESRAGVEILPRGRSASEYADLTRREVAALLVKHLC